jgi:hypothetical protein
MTTVEPSLATAQLPGLPEREDELALAKALLKDVRAGRGRTLIIEAPAGLGKSSLLDSVLALAAGEFLVLRAAGREVEHQLGWGVARSLFEPWLLRLPSEERADLLAGPASSASLLFDPAGADGGVPQPDVGFGILHGLYWLTVRYGGQRLHQ